MAAQIVLDDQVTFVTDPVSPCAGEDFTVNWQEKNAGDETSGQYQDIFDLDDHRGFGEVFAIALGDDQGTCDSQSLDCDPLEPGQSVQRSLTFNLPAGTYQMSLVINGVGPLNLGDVIIDECLPEEPVEQADG